MLAPVRVVLDPVRSVHYLFAYRYARAVDAVEHFIDSSGVVSWRFFSAKADFEFVEWDFSGNGENSNAEEAASPRVAGDPWIGLCAQPKLYPQLQNNLAQETRD